jgi:predicted mannosyl-3-phosphoglycerate phosphatase (HAD superfamily)
MKQQEPRLPPMAAQAQAQTGDDRARPVALRQYHQQRVARLFRQVGEGAEDLYLQDLIVRYRELDPT